MLYELLPLKWDTCKQCLDGMKFNLIMGKMPCSGSLSPRHGASSGCG